MPKDSVSVRSLRGRLRHHRVPGLWTEVGHAVLGPRGIARPVDEAPLQNGGGEVEVVRLLVDDNRVTRARAISCLKVVAGPDCLFYDLR